MSGATSQDDDGPLLETVRRERAEAEARERAVTAAAPVSIEIGNAGGGCSPVRITERATGRVTSAIVCHGRARRARCQFCAGWSVGLCDYPTGGPCRKCKGTGTSAGYNCQKCAGTGREMCNKRVCKKCRAPKEPDEDYCPLHREQAGSGPPKLKRELCRWSSAATFGGKCLRASCATRIEEGVRCLSFPTRRRAMCEPCGEEYLSRSE